MKTSPVASWLGRLPLWLVLNAYAFLLDGITITLVVGTLLAWAHGHSLVAWALGICAWLAFVSAIRLHGTYGIKRHLFFTLLHRNARTLRIASFEDFVDVPCHRLIVYIVLCRLGKASVYREVIKRYYVVPWRRF